MLVEITIIGIIILLIIVIILFSTNSYVPYEPPTPFVPDTLPLSPWTQSISVEGSACNVYTFLSSQPYVIANASIRNIVDCGNCIGDQCICGNPQSNLNCTDDDQIFAIKKQHICRGNLGTSVIMNGQCLQQNGALVNPDTIEQFFQTCTLGNSEGTTTASKNNNRCNGSISLIAFNLKQGITGPEIFNGAMCISTPLYSSTDSKKYSLMTPVLQKPCSLSETYLSYPSQLFRVVRAIYKNKNFTEDPNGQYIQIVHRPSGYILAPSFTTGKLPIIGGLLQFISSQSYWWVLLNNIVEIGALSQIIYVNTPTTFPSVTNKVALLQYLSDPKNVIGSIQTQNDNNVLVSGGSLILGKYITQIDPLNLSKINNTQFLDYSILSIMLANPQNFGI